jgi:hypothetical protein
VDSAQFAAEFAAFEKAPAHLHPTAAGSPADSPAVQRVFSPFAALLAKARDVHKE